MKPLLLISLCAGMLAFTACNKDDNNDKGPDIDYNEFKIISNGNGAVDAITDTEDTEPLRIVQTVPDLSIAGNYNAPYKASARDAAAGIATRASEPGVFPANLPIMFFFNDKIYLASVKDNIEIIVDGESIKGTIVINERANGYAILTFTPWKEFKVNKSIAVTVKKGIQDDGGNAMLYDVNLIYQTTQGTKGTFDNNKGFEKGTEGLMVLGDGNVCEGTTGTLSPQEGKRYGAISTGYSLIAEAGWAIGDASSMLILGPINQKMTSITFYYDFISAEFNDYVASQFDDCAMITVSGPYGAHSEFITSVNTVEEDHIKNGGPYVNTAFEGFDMPDGGDSYTGHTGWLKRTVSFSEVGTPAYVTFTVTDVSDHALSSILAIDNISY